MFMPLHSQHDGKLHENFLQLNIGVAVSSLLEAESEEEE